MERSRPGKRIAGLFELKLGQKLKILVEQQGQINFDFQEKPGGGGGAGTSVTLIDNSPLLIAGEGGAGKLGRRSRASLASPQTYGCHNPKEVEINEI